MISRLKGVLVPHTLLITFWLLLILGASADSQADVRRAPSDTASDRIIVKWRETGIAAIQLESLAARTSRLRDVSGLPLRGVRSLHPRLDVVRLRGAADESSVRAAVARLRADPAVQYAEIDERRFIHAIPNDTRYAPGSDLLGDWRGQWYLADPTAATPAAIGATTAWDTTRGTGLRIAVIDTGIVADHPDLAGKLLAGRDFVCHDSATQSCLATGAIQSLVANDGGGWDADPADPGDWISAADLARSDKFFDGCGQGPNHDEPIDSSWHGTRVAGVIAAVTDNALGIAGVAPAAQILPVRAIGKCSGYTSDLVAAMYWAGGISNSLLGGLAPLTGATRAHILNLSLGGRNACTQTEQDAVTALTNAGVLIVASAGNDGGPIGSPANCRGVLSVSGLRHIGTKVGYSNVSSTDAAITIGAPAGNCVNILPTEPCLYSIETLTNEGTTGPVASNANTSYTYAFFGPAYTGNRLNVANVGTSFSAPIVAGVAALMVTMNGELTTSELISRMQESATAFPVPAQPATGGICHVAALTRDSAGEYTDVQDRDCQCTTATCGAGMLNAPAALAAAARPIAIFTSSATSASLGQRIALDASGSLAAAGRRIVAYQWSTAPSVAVSNPNGALAEIVFPALRPLTVNLTITDDAGRQDSASLTIASTATTPIPEGGRGAMGAELWVLLALLAMARSRARVRKVRSGVWN